MTAGKGDMAATGTILIADDEERILKALGRALRQDGHDVVEASSGRAAQRLLAERAFDVLVIDNIMPDLTGLDLIRDLAQHAATGERPQVVLMTAHATVESAIEAMKLGALDYLQKPFEIDELLVVVRRAVELQRLRGEHRYLLSERDEEFDHYGIVGRSRAMQEVIATLERVAETKSTVLVTGETGTGKELVARAIHDRSAQRDDAAHQGQLRRHSRHAARVGAVRPRPRRVHRRGREQEGQVRAGATAARSSSTRSARWASRSRRSCCACSRSGSSSRSGRSAPQKVDVRVIAATNRDLQQMVAEGKFQEDLFYRLNVIPIRIPPLRERREDIAGAGRALRRQACPAQRAARAAARRVGPRGRSSATTGPATCGSSRTPSSGRSCCRATR